MAIEPFIKCSDIHASIKFYTEVLDFDLRNWGQMKVFTIKLK